MTNNESPADKLNKVLENEAPPLLQALSQIGKNSYFPHEGILGQTAEAKSASINATIGQALDDDNNPMLLNILKNQFPHNPKAFLYASSFGNQELRMLWKKELKRKNPLMEKSSTPVITNGLTHGLLICSLLFAGKDDSIIIPEPYWGNYKLVFQGKRIESFPLFDHQKFNVTGLKEKLRKNVKNIVLINFPNNPTGYTATIQEMNDIAKILKQSAEQGATNIVIIDDAYFGLVYEKGIATESLFSTLSQLHKNVIAIKVDGLTKEAFAWGLRIGFLTFGYKGMQDEVAAVLEDKVAGLVRGTVSNASNISQVMALNALRSPEIIQQTQEKYDVLKHRYEKVKEILSHKKYKEFFEPLPFNSGYFMCVKLKKHDASFIRKKLLEEYSTGVIALGKDVLRIAFSSLPQKQISSLFENIYKACR